MLGKIFDLKKNNKDATNKKKKKNDQRNSNSLIEEEKRKKEKKEKKGNAIKPLQMLEEHKKRKKEEEKRRKKNDDEDSGVVPLAPTRSQLFKVIDDYVEEEKVLEKRRSQISQETFKESIASPMNFSEMEQKTQKGDSPTRSQIFNVIEENDEDSIYKKSAQGTMKSLKGLGSQPNMSTLPSHVADQIKQQSALPKKPSLTKLQTQLPSQQPVKRYSAEVSVEPTMPAPQAAPNPERSDRGLAPVPSCLMPVPTGRAMHPLASSKIDVDLISRIGMYLERSKIDKGRRKAFDWIAYNRHNFSAVSEKDLSQNLTNALHDIGLSRRLIEGTLNLLAFDRQITPMEKNAILDQLNRNPNESVSMAAFAWLLKMHCYTYKMSKL